MVKKWKEVDREVLIQGYGRAMERVNFDLPNGKRKEFYLKSEDTPVVTLALTPEYFVVLVKQFRPGPQEILHELPGGGIEKGESAYEAALRELTEESGYSGYMQYVGSVYECGYASKWRYCFVATDCEEVASQKFDAHEFIEREIIPLSEFRDLMRQGKLTDVDVAYLGLDYLDLL